MSATVWLEPPESTNGLAEVCQSDAKILGARIHEKRKLLQALKDHGRGKCATAKQLRAQIADLVTQQKHWSDSANRLRAHQSDKPLVGSMPNRTRAARSSPPRPL